MHFRASEGHSEDPGLNLGWISISLFFILFFISKPAIVNYVVVGNSTYIVIYSFTAHLWCVNLSTRGGQYG